MGNVDYHIAITLDGFICRDDGSIDGFLMEGEHVEDFVKSNAIEYIEDLKKRKGGDIWLCGGGELAWALPENNLIEKLTLKVNPIIFGSGKKLFMSGNIYKSFKLLSTKQYDNGVILNKYKILKST